MESSLGGIRSVVVKIHLRKGQVLVAVSCECKLSLLSNPCILISQSTVLGASVMEALVPKKLFTLIFAFSNNF